MMKRVATALAISLWVLFFGISSSWAAVQYIDQKPLSQVITTPVGSVKPGPEYKVGFITWGADMGTLHGNGDSLTTQAGSIMASKGLKLKLFREDDFKKQVEMYLTGETPFLRGTVGQINMAMEVLNKDPRTKPIVIYQLSWSGGNAAAGPGGDCLVVKEGINSVADLKGKTRVLQAYGPHGDYDATLLKDAKLSVKDTKAKYVKDLTGTDNIPMEAFLDKDVAGAYMITPDALKLTSGGKVGTGSEGSVKGAKILVSTSTAKRVISDVYVVRSDFFQANRKMVEDFTHALFLSEQSVRELMRAKEAQKDDYRKMVTAGAKSLLDSDQAIADVEALYADCETMGFAGNVQFFTDANWARNFNRVADEIQTAYIGMGLLSRKIPLDWANWDFNLFRAGLTGTEQIVVERFNPEAVAKVIAKKKDEGTLASEGQFSFEIYFKPNQNTFTAELYAEQFTEAINKAATYTGAVITIEGHADVMAYLEKRKANMPESVLVRQRQSAKNLSLNRALAVRDAIIQYATSQGMTFDQSQFTVVGHGIAQPRTGICGSDPCAPKTEQEWHSNMRVVFQFINVEAEADVFRPLN